ncbi:MAG: transcription antitermination factor NusB [Atopobiaceae bacterium]|nr:transcription antitermination factor NusB [Atopobiaceae bacterium]
MAGTRFGGRTLARSQALQLLFQAEATGRTVADVLEGEYALDEGPLDPYAQELALGCDAMLHEIDAVIGATSANWSVSRMPAVDRNLLRLALYEMLQVEAVDVAVAIDECVDLAKAYGTDESSRFVNGLLGKVARRLEEGEDVVAQALEQMSAQGKEGEAEAEAADDELVELARADAAVDVVPEDDLPEWARG